MKYLLRTLCLYLLVSLPLTTIAQLTGEVIYRHPKYYDELWITRLEDTRNTRPLFKHTHGIFEVATEKKGTRIVIVGERDLPEFRFNAYLVDTAHLEKKALNLTDKQFETVWDIDIDPNGNILFTNNIIEGAPPQAAGVYLIPNHELKRPVPNITQLQKIVAYRVIWLPNGKEIVYDTDRGVFLLDISTKAVLRICINGEFPAVSPDGKKLAFVHRAEASAFEIEIISLETMRTLKIYDTLVPHSAFIDLKFYPGGKYIVYTVYGGGFFNPKSEEYQNIAVPLDGSAPFKILEVHEEGVSKFDWWNTTYTVEPTNRLTTLWGKLKQQDSK